MTSSCPRCIINCSVCGTGIYPERRVSGNENELTRAVKTREGYDMNLKITDVPCEMIEIGKQIAPEVVVTAVEDVE